MNRSMNVVIVKQKKMTKLFEHWSLNRLETRLLEIERMDKDNLPEFEQAILLAEYNKIWKKLNQ